MRKPRKLKDEVVRQIEELDDNVLACRDMRHAWAVDSNYYVVQLEGGARGAMYAERMIGCMRCEVSRYELFRVHDDWLERVLVKMLYPKTGYLLHGVGRRNTVGMVRRELWDRSNFPAQVK